MKEARDFSIVGHINNHYDDLREDVDSLESFDDFVEAKEKRRAVLFDFIQIGELVNQLSPAFLKRFNRPETSQLIAIRNRIVHGYSTVRDDIIFNTIKNDLPTFIHRLAAFARDFYLETVKSFLGKTVKVIVDRPIGHQHEGIAYPLNYGYYEGLTALDGEYQDAYVIDVNQPIEACSGKVIAIVHRLDDVEDKLVVATGECDLSMEEIEEKLFFQEQFFRHEILR